MWKKFPTPKPKNAPFREAQLQESQDDGTKIIFYYDVTTIKTFLNFTIMAEHIQNFNYDNENQFPQQNNSN